MIDDDRIRRLLASSALVRPESAREIEALAAQRGGGLFRAAAQSGRVSEADLVANLASALGVPSVSLANFTAKQMLIDVLAGDLVRRHRVLPVGLKPRDGELTLFVAMDDPQDLEALEAISMRCPYPIVPLLAGPLDLDAAIARVYPAISATGPISVVDRADDPRGATRRALDPLAAPVPVAARRVETPPEPRPRGGHSDMFAQVMPELDASHAPEMLSALSLLDDIPRNRHEVPTSPTGFGAIEPLEAQTDLRGRRGAGAQRAATPGPPRGARAPEATGFTRRAAPPSESALARPNWERRPADELTRAVVSILLRRGVITITELNEALDDQ